MPTRLNIIMKKKTQKVKKKLLCQILEECLSACQDDQPGLSQSEQEEIEYLISILADSSISNVNKLESIIWYWSDHNCGET